MVTKNIKGIKKISYFGLTLFSTVLTLATQATESPIRDYMDHPVVGGSIRVPRQKESFLESLEKTVRLLFEDYDTREDEVQKDIKSPPMDDHRQQYRDLHNKMVDKYAKHNPRLVRHKLSTKQEKGASSLVSASEDFLRHARELKEVQEEENRKLQKVGETVVSGAAYGLKAVIDNKIEDTEAKSFFLDQLDRAQKAVLNFFS